MTLSYDTDILAKGYHADSVDPRKEFAEIRLSPNRKNSIIRNRIAPRGTEGQKSGQKGLRQSCRSGILSDIRNGNRAAAPEMVWQEQHAQLEAVASEQIRRKSRDVQRRNERKNGNFNNSRCVQEHREVS